MYWADHDAAHAVAYWHVAGPLSPCQWAEHLADMSRVATWAEGPRPAVLMHVVDFAPTAKQRAELAQRSGQPTYRPYLALVTSNAFLRGALQAIQWLSPRQAYEVRCVPDVPTGLAWLEASRREPLPWLRSMVAKPRLRA